MSSELIKKVDDILEKMEIPERHSYFQIEKFIIGKEVTCQGQLWQIIRELKSRKETVDSYKEQLEEAADNLDLLDIKIQKQKVLLNKLGSDQKDEFSTLNIKETEINIRKLERQKINLINSIENVRKKIKFILEEERFFASAFEKLELTEKIKPFDDRQAQIELWNEKLLEEFNLRILLKTPLDPEFVKTIMALNDDAPVKQHMVSSLKQVQRDIMIKNQIALEQLSKKEGDIGGR